jgi:hypothetical protein
MSQQVFLEYSIIPNDRGLLLESRIFVEHATELSKYEDPIVRVEEDYRGKLKVQTASRIYIQEGYTEKGT